MGWRTGRSLVVQIDDDADRGNAPAAPRRGRTIRLDLPPASNAADVLTAISAVIESTAQDDITPVEFSGHRQPSKNHHGAWQHLRGAGQFPSCRSSDPASCRDAARFLPTATSRLEPTLALH
jgi:hypothetical protein